MTGQQPSSELDLDSDRLWSHNLRPRTDADVWQLVSATIRVTEGEPTHEREWRAFNSLLVGDFFGALMNV
jgi:hypothetical protein